MRYRRRLEVVAVEQGRRTLSAIKRDWRALLKSPRYAFDAVDEWDFTEQYGKLIAGQIMKTYAVGIYEQVRRNSGKALFAKVTFESIAEKPTWYEIFPIFQDKVAIDAEEFYDLDVELRKKYWTIARTKNLRMIDTMKKFIAATIAKGDTTRDFVKGAEEWYAKTGLDPLYPHHLRTVYRTNMSIAFEAAHENFIFQHGFAEALMAWITAGDDNVREEHEAVEGVVETAAFWRSSGLWPPADWGCR